MLDIYVIRHAESKLNEDSKHIGGRSNSTPLSERGKLQAQALGQRLLFEKIVFNEIYSSTAVRNIETAKIVCEKLNYSIDKIIYSENLLELSQGDWEGKERNKIYTPETIAIINSDNWNFKSPNGESQKEVEERMYNFLEKYLLYRFEEDLRVAVFRAL